MSQSYKEDELHISSILDVDVKINKTENVSSVPPGVSRKFSIADNNCYQYHISSLVLKVTRYINE